LFHNICFYNLSGNLHPLPPRQQLVHQPLFHLLQLLLPHALKLNLLIGGAQDFGDAVQDWSFISKAVSFNESQR
jgi:hypothetical protein